MDNRKTIFLDTFVLLEIAKHPDWAENVHKFIEQNSYVLVVGVMHLIEAYKWKRYWSESANFISSLPFFIAENPENITKAEVAHYPDEITLPIAFNPADFPYSVDELRQAIEINLQGKISSLEQNYRNEYRTIWQSMLDNRKTYLPDNGKNYSDVELKVFFMMNVMTWLYTSGHQDFLQKKISASQEIVLERFKSIYLPLVAIFVEYYINKKDGKPSDVGDFYQMGIIPYVDLAILDKERNALIQRVNREKLFPQRLQTCNLAEFRQMVDHHAVPMP
jgi:hypothetical protein